MERVEDIKTNYPGTSGVKEALVRNQKTKTNYLNFNEEQRIESSVKC